MNSAKLRRIVEDHKAGRITDSELKAVADQLRRESLFWFAAAASSLVITASLIAALIWGGLMNETRTETDTAPATETQSAGEVVPVSFEQAHRMIGDVARGVVNHLGGRFTKGGTTYVIDDEAAARDAEGLSTFKGGHPDDDDGTEDAARERPGGGAPPAAAGPSKG